MPCDRLQFAAGSCSGCMHYRQLRPIRPSASRSVERCPISRQSHMHRNSTEASTRPWSQLSNMTSHLPSILHHSSSPMTSSQAAMTSSLPVMALSHHSSTSERRHRHRRRRGAATADDDARPAGSRPGLHRVDCTGTGIHLVDVPRRIMAEKTFVTHDTHFALHLERFYKFASVQREQLSTAQDRTELLLRHLLPRVAKLGIKVGLRLIGSVKTGSVYDGSCVISADDVDVLVMFDTYQVRTVMSAPGYVTIPLDDAQRTEAGDHWRFGWSRDHGHLSPVTVSRTLHSLVSRVLKTQQDNWTVLPFDMQASRSPVTVCDGDWLRVNLVPACAVSSRPGDVTYVVARPYAFDLDATSDVLWRLSTVERESRILDQMDRSDRGARRKAYRILKALVRVEPSLAGLVSYIVRTAVLHAFDSVVDRTPRWQRHSVAAAFSDLLSELAAHLAGGHLPHFFFRQYDLLESVSPRTVARWKDRLRHLASNRGELERVLRRRADELATTRAVLPPEINIELMN